MRAAPAPSATSCPATSSITTNCGSLMPEARATWVAAGIPTRMAARARQGRDPRLPARAASQGAGSHQSRCGRRNPRCRARDGDFRRRRTWPRAWPRAGGAARRPRDSRRDAGATVGGASVSASSFFIGFFRSAAVLGGCCGGILPAHPDPWPMPQVRFLRIVGDIAHRATQLSFIPNQVIVILPLPKRTTRTEYFIRAFGREGLPGMHDGGERVPGKDLEDNVYVIGHDAPRQQSIALALPLP